jgi:serine/threonine protein kinase
LTLKGKFKYFSPEWDTISEEAKEFLNKLIVVAPGERMTVDQAMAHPWIAKECTAKANLAAVGDNLVKNFNAKRKLKVCISI